MKAIYRMALGDSHVADAHYKRASRPQNSRQARTKRATMKYGRRAVRRALKRFGDD